MATSIGAHKNARWKGVLDFLAVAGPIICLIDCVVLPVASALLPFLGMTEFGHGINDQQLFLVVLAICGPIIIPGYLKHRNKRVLAMFAIAISMMFVVNFIDLIANETAHAAISLTAACLLIKANRDNKKLLSCACSIHHHGPKHETPAVQATEAFSQLIAVQNDHVHSNACNHDPNHSHNQRHGETPDRVHSHDHGHSQTNAHVHTRDQGHRHSHNHDDKRAHGNYPGIGHAACLHDVVIALEMQDHGLNPDHFEPRNNLNFEPALSSEAPPSVPSTQSANCCG